MHHDKPGNIHTVKEPCYLALIGHEVLRTKSLIKLTNIDARVADFVGKFPPQHRIGGGCVSKVSVQTMGQQSGSRTCMDRG